MLDKIELVKRYRIQILLTAVVIIGLAFHGLLPGMVGNNVGHYTTEGFATCFVNDDQQANFFICDSQGGDVGASLATNVPFVGSITVLTTYTTVSVSDSMTVVGTIFMIFAVVFGYKFYNYFVTSKYLSVLGIFLYVASVQVLGTRGFGGTYWGFLILPAIMYIFARLFDYAISSKAIKNTIILLASLTILNTLLIFQDGYTLVLANIFGLAFAVAYIALKRRFKAPIIFILGVGVSIFLASVFYEAIFGAGIAGSSPPDFYRSMSADLVTFFLPTENRFLWNLLGIGADWKNLWGDGSNTISYIGIVGLLGLAGAFIVVKSKKFRVEPKLVGLILAAAIGFGLSLGPSIKVNNTKPETITGTVSYRSYLMPSEEATLDLPFMDRVYSKTPGLKSMRAVYRWQYLGFISLIALSMFTLNQQFIHKKRFTPWLILFILFLVVDLLPPLRTISDNIERARQVDSFDAQVLEPLDLVLPENVNVLFAPNAVGGNDFLANYLAPQLGITTYNVGGDKSLATARETRPEIIKQLLDDNNYSLGGPGLLDELNEVGVEFIVVPKFDLRWNAYSWPPASEHEDSEVVNKILKNFKGLITISDQEYFTVYELRQKLMQ